MDVNLARGGGFGLDAADPTRLAPLARRAADGGGHGALWGHVSVAGFDGREDALTLDGQVTTGFLGADWAAQRWIAGLALGHSVGTGGYRDGGCEAGAGEGGTGHAGAGNPAAGHAGA